MSLDRLSLSTVPITPFFNDLRLPEATGFIWKRHERFYLITSWHVVSALDLFTKQHLLVWCLSTEQIPMPFSHSYRTVRA
jgi:hypothetical protein